MCTKYDTYISIANLISFKCNIGATLLRIFSHTDIVHTEITYLIHKLSWHYYSTYLKDLDFCSASSVQVRTAAFNAPLTFTTTN